MTIDQKGCNYTEEELKSIFKSVGNNVYIHRNIALFNPENISIGSNVRIDCFCMMSAGIMGIEIGNYIHIGASTHLFGSGGYIKIEDFCNLSSRVSIFTANDDYTEGSMTNPMISDEYKEVDKGEVILENHSIIGCGSIVLPHVKVGQGAAIGSLSLVNRNVEPFEIAVGTPIRKIRERKRTLLELERQFLARSV